jgi:translation initiation factor 1
MTARIIYSTGLGRLCPNCRRAVQDCVCPKGAPGAAKGGPANGGPAHPVAVRVGREVKGKKRCGSGGTVRGGVIEIQGDHREAIVAELVKLGLPAKKAGG